MKDFLSHFSIRGILSYLRAHKVVSGVVVAILIAGGYFGYRTLFGSTSATSYVTAQVQKGTIIVSVSGSGQISASNQVDLKAKASADVTYVGVKNGQEVGAGTLLVRLDDRDAQKSVRDAEVNLESAKLALEKLKGPEGLTTPKNKENAQSDLKKAYDDGFNNVANAFLDLPTVMSGLQGILYNYDISGNTTNKDFYSGAVSSYDERVLTYAASAAAAYQSARTAYDANFDDYKAASRYSDEAVIDSLITETYTTTQRIAEAVKSANNLVQFYNDVLVARNLKPVSLASTHLSTLNSYTNTTSTLLVNLLSTQSTIQSDKDAITNADLDVASQELSLKQKENALLDVKEKLADYYVYAPFGGVVAEVDVKVGDSASAGTAVATLITKQRTAEVALNEVDVAKVKVGQKVTLTFDAIEGLSISGEVAEVATIGTVTQGVVNYNVKIVFDTQDERVKPGMSVSAAIITDMKQDVLLVPNAAVKSNGTQYVEVLTGTTPQSQPVETGLSNDTMTEITSGIKEGDKVVTQTISANTTNTTTQTSSQRRSTGVGIPGLGGSR